MFSTLLAHTDGWGYGPGPWFLVLPFLWFGLIAFVLWRFRRGAWGAWRGHQSGRSVLAERYARGEISADEYRERRAVLDEVDR